MYDFKFNIGDKIKREKDIFNPSLGFNFGQIILRYSEPIKQYRNMILGPYPELYAVLWNNGIIEKGFLPHGLDHV